MSNAKRPERRRRASAEQQDATTERPPRSAGTQRGAAPSRKLNPLLRTGREFGDGEEAAAKRSAEAQARRDSGADFVFRHWMKEGEEKQVIFLDDQILSGVNLQEHQLKLNNSWRNWFTCIGEEETCPICASGTRPYWVAYFTVLVLDAYEKDGEMRDARNLIGVKWGAWPTFKKVMQMATKEHGQLRGVSMLLSRETSDDAAIGSPIEFEDEGRRWTFFDEEDLAELAAPEIKNQQGKMVAPAGQNILPMDYSLVFPYPEVADLRAVVGGRPVAGEDAGSDWEREEEEKSRSGPRRPLRQSRTKEVESGAEEDEDNIPF